jgi:hypothetical protein
MLTLEKKKESDFSYEIEHLEQDIYSTQEKENIEKVIQIFLNVHLFCSCYSLFFN